MNVDTIKRRQYIIVPLVASEMGWEREEGYAADSP